MARVHQEDRANESMHSLKHYGVMSLVVSIYQQQGHPDDSSMTKIPTVSQVVSIQPELDSLK